MKLKSGLNALIVAMMLLIAMTIPATACEPGAPCKGKTNVGDASQLIGEEKDIIVETALENNQVKELQKQLTEEGFVQKESEAYKVPVELEDGTTSELLVVATPYEDTTSEIKTLLYFYDSQTGESITGVVKGSLTACAISVGACLVYVGACAIACGALLVPDPAEPAEATACLKCIESYAGITSCVTAFCTCADYYCDEGSQWACDHRCP